MFKNNYSKPTKKLKSGSKEPGRNIIGSISKQQLKDIAEKKMEDLNAHDLDEAAKIIAGSARSMGIEVKEWRNQKDLKIYQKIPKSYHRKK